MPNWKKLIVSGSDASLNSLNVTTSLTASGLIYPTVDGDFGVEVIKTDGSGNLEFEIPSTIYEYVKNVSGGTLLKGTPVHSVGTSGFQVEVIAADAGNPATMPATLILNQTLDDEAEGLGIAIGAIKGIDTTEFIAGDVVYVAVGGGFTQTKPTGSALIQNLGIVTKVGVNGGGIILGAGRSNDVPNLPPNTLFVGNENSVATPFSASNFYTGSYTGSFTGDGSGLTNLTVDTSSLVTTSSFNEFTSSYNTGSFTGSFIGDGSGLTNLNIFNISGSFLEPVAFVSQSSVTVTHNLDIEYPVVQVYDSEKNQLIPNSIVSIDNNTIQVGFITETSGHIVVMKGGHILTAQSFSGSFTGSFLSQTDFLPSQTDAYDLGSSTKRWRDLYLSGSSIFLGDLVITEESGQLTIKDSLGDNVPLQGTAASASYVEFSDVANKPALVSGSSQITLSDTTGFTSYSGSVGTLINNLETASGSIRTDFNSYTGSANARLDSLQTYSSSLKTAFSLDGANVTVLGNLEVAGTTTTIDSTTVDIGTNIIDLNGTGAVSAGLRVKDVTSPNQVSGSLLWNATTDRWTAGPLGSESNILLASGDGVVTGSSQITLSDTTGFTSYSGSVATSLDSKLNLSGGTLTGDLTVPDKIIHSGDTNTAIRFPADDTVAIETNGTEKIRATSTTVVVNETGADFDFRVEGDTDANLLFVDASTDRVGIGTSSPASKLDVAGGKVGVSTISGRSYTTGLIASQNPNFVNGTGFDSIPIKVGDIMTFFDNQVRTVTSVTDTQLTVSSAWTISYAGVTATGVGGVGIESNSVERIRVTADGNVGIGTTSPNNTYQGLTIYGSDPSLSLSGNGTSSWNWIQYMTSAGVNNFSSGVNQTSTGYYGITTGAGMDSPSFSVNSSDDVGLGGTFNGINLSAASMVVKGTGNVGIGTNDPSSKLEIRGLQSATKNNLLSLSKFDYGVTNFFQNYSNLFYTNGKSLEVEIEALPLLQLATNNAGTEGKVLFPNGNVGIGTTAPSSKLHVSGSVMVFPNYNFIIDNLDNGDEGGVIWRNADGSRTTSLSVSSVNDNSFARKALVFSTKGTADWTTAATERMRITSAGNVGVGTTSPSALLHVSASGATNDFLVGTNKLFVSASGNVGIGNTTPATKLDVSGSIRTSTGILFGTDTAAANTLDDYEEGSFTLTLSDSNSNNATMGSANVFRYIKIGTKVTISGTMAWTSIASLTAGSRIRLTGLPFTTQAVTSMRWPAIAGTSLSGSFNIPREEIAFGADQNLTFIYGTKVTGNNVDGELIPADLGSSGTIFGLQLTYFTT